MRFFIKFMVWYVLMWMVFIPLGWYLFTYVTEDLLYIQDITMGVPAVLGLLIILHSGFREFIWDHFAFMYQCFETIEQRMQARRIARLSKKDYVYMKKEWQPRK